MKPPICAYCHSRFSLSKTAGKLVYFKESEADKQYNERFRTGRMVGHPAGRDWFCEKHVEEASSLKHLTKKEALMKMKED
jgi:hypothetical protein